ncbi:MAG: hypothetical protein ACP5XB_26525 [Isosphaeraceae bacterium]
MSRDTVLYKIESSRSLIASTTLDGFQTLLRSQQPGRYAIDEVTSWDGLLLKSRIRRWGWAVKHDDGRVVLLPELTSDASSETMSSFLDATGVGRNGAR